MGPFFSSHPHNLTLGKELRKFWNLVHLFAGSSEISIHPSLGFPQSSPHCYLVYHLELHSCTDCTHVWFLMRTNLNCQRLRTDLFKLTDKHKVNPPYLGVCEVSVVTLEQQLLTLCPPFCRRGSMGTTLVYIWGRQHPFLRQHQCLRCIVGFMPSWV